MTYSLSIIRRHSDPIYVNGLTQWVQVTNYLRKRLDQYTIGVNIYKYSSNDRLLGQKYVTMGNLCEVAFSLRDKQVLL